MVLHEDAIKALGQDERVVGIALQAAAEAVTQEAKRLAPTSPAGSEDHASGNLRSSIGWELMHVGGQLLARVRGDAYTAEGFNYGYAMEVGTRAHLITPRDKGYPLRNRRTGQVFGYLVHHPGTKAVAFLRGALFNVLGGK